MPQSGSGHRLFPDTDHAAGVPRPEGRLRPDFAWIDVEASSLHVGSWPVSVGWAFDDLAGGMMLIRPEPDWDDWSWQSEQIHGISRDLLVAEGVPAAEVARRLNEALAGCQVHSDTGTAEGDGGSDLKWLWRLFSSVDMKMEFRVFSEDLATAQQLGLKSRADLRRILPEFDEARELAERLWPHSHDAFEDARHLAAEWRLTVDDDLRCRAAEYLHDIRTGKTRENGYEP